MKVAVCLFGLLRSFDLVNQTLIENIINPLNADVFIATPENYYPNKSKDNWTPFTKDDSENTSEEKLQQAFRGNLKEALIISNDYNKSYYEEFIVKNNLPEIFKISEDIIGQFPVWRMCSMYHNIKLTLDLKKNYELKNNFKYDLVILTRPDMKYFSLIDLNKIDMNILNLPENQGSARGIEFKLKHCGPVYGFNKFFCDHIMIGTSSIVDMLSEVYDDIVQFHQEGVVCNNETMLAYKLLKNGIEFDYRNFILYQIIR